MAVATRGSASSEPRSKQNRQFRVDSSECRMPPTRPRAFGLTRLCDMFETSALPSSRESIGSTLRADTQTRTADLWSASDLAASGRRRGGRVGVVVGASSPDRWSSDHERCRRTGKLLKGIRGCPSHPGVPVPVQAPAIRRSARGPRRGSRGARVRRRRAAVCGPRAAASRSRARS